MKVIWRNDKVGKRIIEIKDETYDLEDLKGDCFNPEVNPDIPALDLKREERAFETMVEIQGVYGYVLETWNPEIDGGWESDGSSCFGFIKTYVKGSKTRDHYIVDELVREALGDTDPDRSLIRKEVGDVLQGLIIYEDYVISANGEIEPWSVEDLLDHITDETWNQITNEDGSLSVSVPRLMEILSYGGNDFYFTRDID